MAEVDAFDEDFVAPEERVGEGVSPRWSSEQEEAYERAVNLLVDLLGEVEPLSEGEERVLEQAVSDSLYLRGDEACFDNVVEWLGSSEVEGAKSLGRLLGVVKSATGGSVDGGKYGLPHVAMFSSPWVNSSPVSFVSWEISTLSDEDDTPVLRVGDDYAIVLTSPVASKMYRALGGVLREVAPEEVRKPKKSFNDRWDGVAEWAKSHKFFAIASAIVVTMVLVGVIYGFTEMGTNSIPL